MKIYLAEWRIRKGYTIRGLAKDSGVAASYILRIEAGAANPSIGVLCKLAKSLGISVGELLEK